MATISVGGFEAESGTDRVWTPDGRWGLVRNADGTLTLLDSDGAGSNHALSEDRAQYIIDRVRVEGAEVFHGDLMWRWDYYASAQ